MNTRRTTGRLALIMSVVVTLLLGLTPPVTAAVPRFAVPGGPAGKFSVAVAAESVTLTLEGEHYDRDEMTRILEETQNRNPRLSDTFREDFQANPHGMEGGGEDFDNWPDFDGQLSMTDTGIAMRIDGGQPLTNASWWAEVLATVAGGLTALVMRAICIGFFPEAAVLCVAVGGFVGGMTRGMIIQTIDGTLKDARAWAKTLGGAIVMAATGAAWEAGVKNWAKDVLPGHIERLGQEIDRLGRKLAAGWERTCGEISRRPGSVSAAEEATRWVSGRRLRTSRGLQSDPSGGAGHDQGSVSCGHGESHGLGSGGCWRWRRPASTSAFCVTTDPDAASDRAVTGDGMSCAVAGRRVLSGHGSHVRCR